MTTTPATQAILPVTQSDRDAAAEWLWDPESVSWDRRDFDKMKSGSWDDHSLIQAFARHRQAHPLPGDALREALEGLSLAADEINGDIDLQVNGDHSEEVDVNGEYYVTLSAAKVGALNKAICGAQRLLKQAPTLPANPTIEKILTLAKRKYHFQPTIGAVLREHMPTGTTGHDWDDREAFNQAIAILDHIPDLAALTPSALSGDAGEGQALAMACETILALREALDAAHYYIDASPGELADRGITRDDALRIAREKRPSHKGAGE